MTLMIGVIHLINAIVTNTVKMFMFNISEQKCLHVFIRIFDCEGEKPDLSPLLAPLTARVLGEGACPGRTGWRSE